MKELPKVLLHDHLDGGLRPETIIEIAAETGYQGLPTNKTSELALWFKNACDSGSLELYLETLDRKSTRLNSSHIPLSRMPSSA